MGSSETLRNRKNNFEYNGLLGKDEEYEFREFHADKDGVILIPEGWEMAFMEGDTALYRRRKNKSLRYGH